MATGLLGCSSISHHVTPMHAPADPSGIEVHGSCGLLQFRYLWQELCGPASGVWRDKAAVRQAVGAVEAEATVVYIAFPNSCSLDVPTSAKSSFQDRERNPAIYFKK